MANVIKFEDLPVEALTEACKEAYEETSWAFERAIDKAINFGRLLCIAKSKVPHGGWSRWVADTFENQASLRSIQRFMQVAESNATNPSLLEGVKTLDEALGLIQIKRVTETPKPGELKARLLVETSMAIGSGEDVNIIVQPSLTVGRAHVSMLNGDSASFTKRQILREYVSNMIDVLIKELAKKPCLEWEFHESASRVETAFFAMEEKPDQLGS